MREPSVNGFELVFPISHAVPFVRRTGMGSSYRPGIFEVALLASHVIWSFLKRLSTRSSPDLEARSSSAAPTTSGGSFSVAFGRISLSIRPSVRM